MLCVNMDRFGLIQYNFDVKWQAKKSVHISITKWDKHLLFLTNCTANAHVIVLHIGQSEILVCHGFTHINKDIYYDRVLQSKIKK